MVLFWHGGGWRRGDKRWHGCLYSNVGIACARAGFVGVVCNYRLQPQVSSWRDQVDDVAAAVAWATRASEQYGGDSSQLFLAGHSAGAHLVASLLSDASALERHGVSAEQAQERIRGAVLLGGVYDVTRLGRLPVGGGVIARNSFGERRDGREWAAASPGKVVRAMGLRASLLRRAGGLGEPDAAAIRRGDVLEVGVRGRPGEGGAEARAMSASPREAAALDALGRGVFLDEPGSDSSGRETAESVLDVAAAMCPLLTVPTLVLNASDDFHLDGDAVSLIRATGSARKRLMGVAGASREGAHSASLADPDTEEEGQGPNLAEETEETTDQLPGSVSPVKSDNWLLRATQSLLGLVRAGGGVAPAQGPTDSAASAAHAAAGAFSGRRSSGNGHDASLPSSLAPAFPSSSTSTKATVSAPASEGEAGAHRWGWTGEEWRSNLGLPDAVGSFASAIVTGAAREAELLEGRLQHAWDQPVVASYEDKVALPVPLVEWEQLREMADASVIGRLSAGEPHRRAATPQAATVTNGSVADAELRYTSNMSFRGLEIRAQPETNMVWGRVGHRNHITLVALIGQEGDPTTSAIVDFVRSGHASLAKDPIRAWDGCNEASRR